MHRLQGERYAQRCIMEHDRDGGGGVMAWAAIWFGGQSAAVNIIRSIVLPTAYMHDPMFQDDNAAPHRTSANRQMILDAGLLTLPWPSRSPDLFPIEHAWNIFGRKVIEPCSVPAVRRKASTAVERYQSKTA